MRSISPLSIAVSLAVLAAPCAASAQSARPSVVEARLAEVTDISGEPNAPRICLDDQQQICVDGSWRVKFEIRRTLTGPPISGAVFREAASARPRINLNYLLVVVDLGGRREVEWSGLLEYGLCMETEEITQLRLTDAVARFPCRQ